MNNENKTQLQNILTIIDVWKLNKALLASKINMKHSTFKNKLNEKYPQYKLTESEQKKIIEVLKEMATDIEIVDTFSGMEDDKIIGYSKDF